MNLSAITRKLPLPTIEPLEPRIAPATLVNPTTVTFQDKNGDAATVTISKPLFTAANIAKVFTFDTGSVNGDNSTPQQLELLDIAALGHAARGIDISITAVPVNGSPGIVNVGYINASTIDLGNVTVGGDLGRIAAGDLTLSTQGLHSLTVQSLGAHGLATQAAGGNLNTLISGPVGSITINGDIVGASIGIGGGAKGALGSLLVAGSIDGGAGAYAGSVRTQGGIRSVTVDGSIIGGGGDDSGIIGTAGSLGVVLVEGSITGGGGTFSGAILSTKAIQSVTIDGNLAGGAGPDSGQVGTASNLGPVIVSEAVTGGGGNLSGTILATGNIASVAISDGFTGGSGAGSGEIGSGASIGLVTIAGGMTAGAEIFAVQNIQGVSATGQALAVPGIILGPLFPTSLPYTTGIANSFIIAQEGSIGSIQSTGIAGSGINAGGNIGPVGSSQGITGSVFVAGFYLGPGFSVADAGTFDNASAASFGFGSSKSAAAGHIGNINVTGGDIDTSTFLAGVHGAGADGTFGTKDDLVATGSGIGAITSPGGINTVFMESGNIGATSSGEIAATTYIATDTAVSAGGIGPITIIASTPQDFIIPIGIITLHDSMTASTTAVQLASPDSSHGIYNSTFISNAGIGNVNVTIGGARESGENAGISSTLFQAGHAIGTVTVTDSASGTGGSNYGIINTTFNAGLNGYGGIGDISSTLTDAGPDGNSAAIADCKFDATVCACMAGSMGSISAESADTAPTAAGILDSVFRVYGNIGPISATMDSGSPTAPAIEGSTFSAFGSIGDINVYGAVMPDANGPSRFLAGYDIGSDMIFGNEDLGAKSLALHAGQSIGDVTVTGYFEGSDIAASVNPGAGYVFGSSANTNIGAGGSIGLVNLATQVSIDGNPFTADHPTSHAIEAANFALGESNAPSVAAFGVNSSIPIVLYVDGGANDVRITNLTQPSDSLA